MSQANILETKFFGQSQAQSDQALSQCLKQLSSADRDYYRRRAVQESEAAQAASCGEARRAHEELARAYRLLCSSNDSCEDAHLASELAMLQLYLRPGD